MEDFYIGVDMGTGSCRYVFFGGGGAGGVANGSPYRYWMFLYFVQFGFVYPLSFVQGRPSDLQGPAGGAGSEGGEGGQPAT